MDLPETDLEMARRHVEQGRHHLQREREIVDAMREKARDTVLAEELLVEFEHTLEIHLTHLRRLLAA